MTDYPHNPDDNGKLVASALAEMHRLSTTDYGLFDFAEGRPSAIALASAGMPVCPLRIRTGEPLAPPSAEPAVVARAFDAAGPAWVGYQTADAPIYTVLTNCRATLLRGATSDRRILRLRKLIARDFPPSSLPTQKGFALPLVLVRQVGDQETGFNYDGTENMEGQVTFVAGYRADGEPRGLTPTGFMPICAGIAVGIATEAILRQRVELAYQRGPRPWVPGQVWRRPS